MSRRRPLGRRPLPGRGRRPAVRQALARAHRAMERGDTARAAQIFERLSEGAFRRGMNARAAWLLLQAAHAEALGENARGASSKTGRALDMVAHSPPPSLRVAAATERVVGALRQGGFAAEAVEIEERLAQLFQQSGITRQELAARLSAASGQQRGQLPAKCLSCAGPLLPNEVEWHDADTAECPYCGSVVKAE